MLGWPSRWPGHQELQGGLRLSDLLGPGAGPAVMQSTDLSL